VIGLLIKRIDERERWSLQARVNEVWIKDARSNSISFERGVTHGDIAMFLCGAQTLWEFFEVTEGIEAEAERN
jgi:hypothetical protein